jgi:hypothetical protein
MSVDDGGWIALVGFRSSGFRDLRDLIQSDPDGVALIATLRFGFARF